MAMDDKQQQRIDPRMRNRAFDFTIRQHVNQAPKPSLTDLMVHFEFILNEGLS
jgi:hypothetical protein